VTAPTDVRPALLVVYAPGSPAPDNLLASLAGAVEPCFVMLVDYTEAHILDAFPDALCVESSAPETAVRWAQERSVAGIITYSELALPFTAALAQLLGLAHHDPAAARAMTDKLEQRRRLAAAGVPTPRFAEIRSDDDIAAAAVAVGFPAVLKPRRGMGSTLVTRVGDEHELHAAVAAVLRHRAGDYRVRAAEPALLLEAELRGGSWHDDERFGDYVSVESLIDRGRIVHLTVTDKLPLVPSFREAGNVMPSSLAPGQQEAVRATATEALQALGAYHGAAHTEIKLCPDGPRVIEVNGRLGGGLEYPMRMSSGFDPVLAIALLAVGRGIGELPRFHRHAMNYWVPPPSGAHTVTAIHGLEQVRAMDGVEHIAMLHGIGDRLDSRFGTDTVMIVLAAAAHGKALLDLRDAADAALTIDYEPAPDPS
jgi:biotin carboxylase